MTPEEWRSHYSLWIVMKAPIMIGCDLSTPKCRSALPVRSRLVALALIEPLIRNWGPLFLGGVGIMANAR